MKQLVFFLCNEMLASSVTLPLEQLKAAEAMARSKRLPTAKVPMQYRLVSIDGNPVKSHAGIYIGADSNLQFEGTPELIYLPALWRNPQQQIEKNKGIIPWLQAQYKNGATIAAVGTGCCFLAEAGLLRNRVATTHWHYFDTFEQRYPDIDLQKSYFITESDRIFCTGSTNALADLTVFFIRNFYNATIANEVERHFFHEIRQNYLNKATSLNLSERHSDEIIAEIQSDINASLDKTILISTLAKKHKLSIRSLNRRFKNSTGLTPINYLQKQRMQLAADLLKNSNLSTGDIAFQCGYSDLAHFSKLFKRAYSTSAHKYRETLRGKLFTVGEV